MAKTERLYIRLTPELKERLQAAAEAEGRHQQLHPVGTQRPQRGLDRVFFM